MSLVNTGLFIEGTNTTTITESFFGTAFNDTIYGYGGNDNITGGRGDDYIDGGPGTDSVGYNTASSAVIVDLGVTGAQNTLGAGIDTLISIENITGSNYDDTLTGNSEANSLNGGAGSDTIYGLDGDDFIDGGAGDDILSGGLGNDTLAYVSATSAITIDLSLTTSQKAGGSGIDTISGFEDIGGSNYADTITGSSADNWIYGRGGADTLTGGLGADTFYFDAQSIGSVDNILDFSVTDGDKLDITNLLFGYDDIQSAIDDFVTFTEAGGNTTVSVDRDGQGTAYSSQTFASLTAVTGLDADLMLTNGNLIA